jgi:hypothetical protein
MLDLSVGGGWLRRDTFGFDRFSWSELKYLTIANQPEHKMVVLALIS